GESGAEGCAGCALGAGGGRVRGGEEEVDAARFELRPLFGDTLGAEELAARLDDPELVPVDARVPARYRGEPNPIDKVPGRIPGAVNAPWNETLPDLPAGEVVAYCGSGVRACVVLHRVSLAGRGGELYPGSWSDWAARDVPSARGW